MHSYPLVYSVIVLPLSVVRWITGFGTNAHQIPSVATFIVIFIYGLSGVLNAILFLLTRSELLLLGNASPAQRKGLGLAPGITLTVDKSRPSGATDTDSAKSQQQPPLPLGLKTDTEDGGWHLPTVEPDSDEET